MADRPKVFCIGFPETGGASLTAALTALRYRVAETVAHHWTPERLDAEGADHCTDMMHHYDAAAGMPWAHFYERLDEAFPGSKFILTMRDPDDWFDIVSAHSDHRMTNLNAFAFGGAFARPQNNRDHWIAIYRTHIESVQRFFRGRRGDLLEMDIFDDDGWERLCPFLKVRKPAAPFPKRERVAPRPTLAHRIKRGFQRFGGGAS